MDIMNSAVNSTEPSSAPEDGLLVALSVFQAYCLPAVLLVGLFGNVSTVVIFLRRFHKDSATSQYCIALAASDTGVLLFMGLKNYLNQGLAYLTSGQYSFNPVVYSVPSCKTLRYFEQIFMFLSSWFIAMFSMERCFAVWFPYKRAQLLTNGRRRIALLVMVGIGFVIQIHIVYFYTVFEEPLGLNCWYAPAMPAYDKMSLLMLSMFSTIGVPGSIILTMNILISAKLLTATRSLVGKTGCKQIMERKAREAKTIITLLCISVFFFISMMPTFVVWTYLDYISLVLNDKQGMIALFPVALFTDSLTIFNYSLNFIIYGSALDFFRKDLMTVLMCCRREKKGDVFSRTISAPKLSVVSEGTSVV